MSEKEFLTGFIRVLGDDTRDEYDEEGYFIPEFRMDNHHLTQKLVLSERTFRETDNPVWAIQAFILACSVGVYPPISVVNWINDSFKNWVDQKGEKTLDECFGLKRGRGQGKYYAEILRGFFIDGLMREIWQNTQMFEISAEAAVVMVAGRINEPFAETLYKPETLERYCPRFDRVGLSSAVLNVGSSLQLNVNLGALCGLSPIYKSRDKQICASWSLLTNIGY